ncbi:MAG: hypothetical protein PHW04_00845 [Candidatus Wallbacteria bacterium]|nr:hypothetical protein [Candidatus Wallbacteria bacterium]
MNWRVHPLVEDRKRLATILLIILAFLAGLFLIGENIGWVALAALLFFMSLHGFFFPTEYLMEDSGITITHLGVTSTRKWSDFQRVLDCRNGVFLSPFAKPSRLDNFRGLFLPSKAEKKIEILAFARQKTGTVQDGKK